MSSAAASSLRPRACEREAELIVGLAARRLQPCGLLQCRDRVRHFAILKQRLAEREVRPGKRGREVDHLSQLFDLLRRAVGRTRPVGDAPG